MYEVKKPDMQWESHVKGVPATCGLRPTGWIVWYSVLVCGIKVYNT